MPQHAKSAGAQKSPGFANAETRDSSTFAALDSAFEHASRGAGLPGANGRSRKIAQLRESIGASPRVLSQRLQLEHSFGYPQAWANDGYASPESIPSRVVGAFAGSAQRLTPAQAVPGKEAGEKFVVEDGESPGPGQAERSIFLAHLRKRVEQVAREVLARIGMNEEDCPYIPYWFGYYADRTLAQVEAAIGRYAPEAMNQTDWRACAEQVALKVSEAFEKNVGTGSLDGVPRELPRDLHEREPQIPQAKAAISESDTVQACAPSEPPEKIGGLPSDWVKDWGLQPGADKEVTVHTKGSGGRTRKSKKLAPTYKAPVGTRLYHATYPGAVASIKSTGLDPNYGGKSGGSDYDHWARNCKGYVYLTPAGAEAAAGLLQNFWMGQGDPKDPPRNKTNLPNVTVLEITAPADGLDLEADPDLGGVSVRTRTMVDPTWIVGETEFEAGPNDPEYREAIKAKKKDRIERYQELLGDKKSRQREERRREEKKV